MWQEEIKIAEKYNTPLPPSVATMWKAAVDPKAAAADVPLPHVWLDDKGEEIVDPDNIQFSQCQREYVWLKPYHEKVHKKACTSLSRKAMLTYCKSKKTQMMYTIFKSDAKTVHNKYKNISVEEIENSMHCYFESSFSYYMHQNCGAYVESAWWQLVSEGT
jgi:hypothetical protein